MNKEDKKALARLVLNYPIEMLLDAFQEAIERQVDELVNMDYGLTSSDMVKKMSLVVHHLSIFPRG